MSSPTVDYNALAKQAGAIDSTPPSGSVDYAALAKQAGATSSEPAAKQPTAGSPALIQPQGSAAGRFFGNLWDKTAGGAIQTARVLSDIMTTNPTPHPGPFMDFLQNVINSHIDQGQKAKAAFEQGNPVEAAGHILAAALPFVGPAAASVGEQIGGSQAKLDRFGKVIEPQKAPDIAGGLGSATALIAPMAVGPVIGRLGGKLDTAADAAAGSLAKSSLKGGYTVNTPAADVDSAVSTMRENQVPLTPAGQAKIEQALIDVRKSIQGKVNNAAAAGVKIDPQAVAQRLDDLRSREQTQVNPTQDLKDIDKVRQNFLDQHTVNVPGKPASSVLNANGQPAVPATPATSKIVPIPADEAQAIKVGTNIQNADKYGKLSPATLEAEKALTRGLKEELEAQIPELAALNANQAKLINLDDILGKAVNKYTNSAGFVGDLAHTGVASSALRSVLANPVLKARLALAIDTVRQANPGKFAAPAGTGTAAVNALIADLTPQQQQQ